MNARAWSLAAIRPLLAILLLVACGRSSLSGLLPVGDGGPLPDSGFISDGGNSPPGEDAGPCDPSSCYGCCSNGTCITYPSTNLAFCGNTGEACIDCTDALGCVQGGGPDGGAYCYRAPLGGCDCPGGCCTADLVCHAGTADSACGSNQSLCTVCPPGSSCGSTPDNGQPAYDCIPAASPPSPGCGTCSGCCTDIAGTPSTCLDGTSNTACGSSSSFCFDCTVEGLFCLPLPSGAMGCVNTGCGPGTCDGCCDSTGNCQEGFVDGACGSRGALCTDCTTDGSTCDETVSPRVCTNQQSSCPAPYPGCPAGITTQPPTLQPGACGTSDLSQASAACAGGATSAACLAFFQAETANVDGGATCAACLQPFDVPFADGAGIYLCAAPFLDASCNEDTGCYIDCETKSCVGCATGEVAPCETNQQTANCATYTNVLTCVQAAFGGSGAFCNPLGYSSFGEWLGAVGASYCGGGDAGP